MTKSMIIVVPPAAAALVPVKKSSDCHGAHEGQLHVRVRVDAAGHHVGAARVDHPRAGRGVEVGADGGDGLALNEHVGALSPSAVTTVPPLMRTAFAMWDYLRRCRLAAGSLAEPQGIGHMMRANSSTESPCAISSSVWFWVCLPAASAVGSSVGPMP
jgi:hypothetical protein